MLAVTQSPDHWSRSWYCWHLTRPPWLDLPWWSCGTGRSGDQLLDRYKVYNVLSISLWVTQFYCCTTGNGTGGEKSFQQGLKPRASGIPCQRPNHWAVETLYINWLSSIWILFDIFSLLKKFNPQFYLKQEECVNQIFMECGNNWVNVTSGEKSCLNQDLNPMPQVYTVL